MTKVKKITISGFRGILPNLELDLQKGGQAQSVVLYGRNGTGKSSVTDAWEWLTTGKIMHLAREGAEEGAYPHMAAKPGDTFVKVEFSEQSIGTVGLNFNNKRVTLPNATGNIAALRKVITHPCHIRYGDLTRFVFLRKSERYDALASLMGFVPQMEYQKALRRIQTHLTADLELHERLRTEAETGFIEHFNLDEVDYSASLLLMAKLCINHGFATEATDVGVKAAAKLLEAAVTNDPNARKLADLQTLESAIKATKTPLNLKAQVADLRGAVAQLKAEQKEHLQVQLLVPLFKAADGLFAKIEPSGICPLCHNQFDGDLKEHVKSEFARMQHLQELLTQLQTAREALSVTLSRHKGLILSLAEAMETANRELLNEFPAAFKDAAKAIDEAVNRVGTLLNFDSTNLTDELVTNLSSEEDSLFTATTSFDIAKPLLLDEIQNRKATLEKDPARVKLVTDNQFVATGLTLTKALDARRNSFNGAQRLLVEFGTIVDDYVDACLEDVQKRFDQISDKVKVFFETLEKDTVGLGSPKMKLLTDQDRSVVLEVFFHDSPIHPAHKYLSESQLNSFGLAVFIASATHFNKDCQFVLLDDVVNSFDAYKRPHLIDLMKNHLNEHQVVLLTHDRFWRDLLHRRLPHWKRLDFTNYNFGFGPSVAPAKDSLERIADALNKDEAEEASSIFARYLEDVMQDLCESFEVQLKFNRRNEYTLDTLIDRFRMRVLEKLKADHPLTKALEQLFQDNAYRNWSVHCKNPESPIQSSEIRAIIENWKGILTSCQCQACSELLKYDGKGGFICDCGKGQLQKRS